MIHLLLIAEESQALAHAASLLSSSDHKVIRKDNFDSSRSLLDTGVFDLLVVLIAGTDESLGLLRSIRAETGSLPLVALATTETVGVDQKAYNAGADLVLHAPISHDSFVRATRHWLNQPANNPASVAKPAFALAQTPSVSMTTSALEVLRNFSKVLSYSLDHEQFTQHFVLKLREILSVNRVAIFLESPPPGTSVQPQDGRGRDRLSCVAAVGIPSDLLACIELSRQNGIGRNITRIGQILRADVDVDFSPASDDVKIRREFEILGCQVALPITDRERTLGVALIGGRVTGNPLNDAELQLVYHLLEELGLAVKNSWLHHQLTESHRLFSDVLGCISIGSLVIGSDLAVQHANRAFLRFIRGEAQSDGRLDFSELPPPLASALHDLAENGRLTEPFFLTPEKNPGRTYRVSLVPFPSPDRRLPQPVIALIEDFTQIQAVQRAEVEASNLKLIALIAKRFAHEIRNSLVPLSTHHQLIDTDYDSPEFRESLKTALGRETGRIQRFTEQMLFLSQPAHPADGWISIGALLHEAFNQATRALGADAHLAISGGQEDRAVRVHHASLVHALEEIFINSLQETTPGGVIRVELSNDSDAQGAASISLRFRDEGAGFTRETATRATEPFFTTRTTGVGLGLTVARRIIENHSGRLEVNEKHNLADADIAIHLPLD